MRQTPFLLGTRISMGVSCEALASQVAVIPAKAGIHSANFLKCAIYGLDSRFRGNDLRIERNPIRNDTSTCLSFHAQRDHWIDARGPPRRQVASKQSHDEEQQRDRGHGRQVVRRKPKKHASDEPAGGKRARNSERYPKQSKRQRFSQYGPKNGRRLRAERHANTDFGVRRVTA